MTCLQYSFGILPSKTWKVMNELSLPWSGTFKNDWIRELKRRSWDEPSFNTHTAPRTFPTFTPTDRVVETELGCVDYDKLDTKSNILLIIISPLPFAWKISSRNLPLTFWVQQVALGVHEYRFDDLNIGNWVSVLRIICYLLLFGACDCWESPNLCSLTELETHAAGYAPRPV